MSEEVLAIRDLRIEFPELFRTVEAVRGADLSVHQGEIMGLVGESGDPGHPFPSLRRAQPTFGLPNSASLGKASGRSSFAEWTGQ